MILCDNELCKNLLLITDGPNRCSHHHVQLVSTHHDVKDWIMICASYSEGSPSTLRIGDEWVDDDGLYLGQIKPKKETIE